MSSQRPRIPASIGASTRILKGNQTYKASEIVNTGRAMLLRALEIFEEKELITPAEHLSYQFKDNPLRFMEIYAKFMPKDIHVTPKRATADDYSTAELQDILQAHVERQLSDNKTECLTIEQDSAKEAVNVEITEIVSD